MKYILIWIMVLAMVTIAIPVWLNLQFSSYNDDESISQKIDVYFVKEDKVESMDLEEYILCVLMAEMPASFETEALKAQAVAARTYTVNKTKTLTDKSSHSGADICTDFAHCQAYISKKEVKEKWGSHYKTYIEKCEKAVKETQNLIAVYNGEPINAVFHSFAGGRTENASDVWGSDVGYLRSVESPGDSAAPKFKTELRVTKEEFKETVNKEKKTDFSLVLVGEATYTEGGAVEKIKIGNNSFKGTEIRKMFSLRSACFEIVAEDEDIVFKVKGYGHGVGMSQYGANHFAKEGRKFDEILKKYYTGIEIVKLDTHFE